MSRKRTSLRKVRKLIKGYMLEFTSSRDLGDLIGISHVSVQTFLKQLQSSGFSFERFILYSMELMVFILMYLCPDYLLNMHNTLTTLSAVSTVD